MLRIVVVDDHELVRKGIAAALADDYDVCGEADNAADAVRTVQELRPDLVVLDLNLRGEMTGNEAAKQIRILSPRTKILVLSLHDSDTIQHMVKLIGADGFLSKNCTSDELRETIAALLRSTA